MHLVASERPRLLGVGFQEEPGASDERGGVVSVESKAEVAMSVDRRRGGQYERVMRAVTQEVAHRAEVIGDEIDRAGLEARPGDMRQEVRHMTEPIAEGSVQVPTIVERVHLVDVDAVQVIRGRRR
jgi:hypothetical protein